MDMRPMIKKYPRLQGILDLAARKYQGNDPAHQLDHALDVAKVGLRLLPHTPDVREELFLVAALLHDAEVQKSRDWHHLNASLLVAKGGLPELDQYSKTDRAAIAHSILNHRSSVPVIDPTNMCWALRAADCGEPDLAKKLDRSYKYQLAHTKGLDEPTTREIARKHISKKYGRNGTATYYPIYEKEYGPELNAMWDEIDRLSEAAGEEKVDGKLRDPKANKGG